MQHTARLLSGIGRVASGLHPTAVHVRAGGPTGPRQASLDLQPRPLHRALFLVEEGGALERPPVRDAAKGLACASHYLGLRGAFATLARQDWAAVAEWLIVSEDFRYIQGTLQASLQYGAHTLLSRGLLEGLHHI